MLRSGRVRLTHAVVIATASLGVAAPVAAAEHAQPPAATGSSHAGLGVITVVSHTGVDTAVSFLFSGAQATAFLLAVPDQATLSTLSSTQVGHLLTLTTLSGEQVHYRVESLQPTSLLIKLHSPQPNLRLSFGPSLFTWSAHESALIRAHRAEAVRMGVAFTGTAGPSQLIASKFQLTP